MWKMESDEMFSPKSDDLLFIVMIIIGGLCQKEILALDWSCITILNDGILIDCEGFEKFAKNEVTAKYIISKRKTNLNHRVCVAELVICFYNSFLVEDRVGRVFRKFTKKKVTYKSYIESCATSPTIEEAPPATISK